MDSNSVQQTVSGSGNIFSGSGNVFVYQNPIASADTQDRTNIRILLDKVKTFWVKGVLEKSLYHAILLELGKETQADAVDHPWASVMELPDNTSYVIEKGTNILDVFDQSNRALLILGEPGSGKTITLLELARTLIQRAENDSQFGQPVPVVFNLSSWSNKRQPLLDWMAEELSKGYQVNKRIGRLWLEQNRLLPLLDGLDEVKSEYRDACVRTINDFSEEFGLSGLAVSCRQADYVTLTTRLKLNAALSLQPLSPKEIDSYLESAGSNLITLREAVQKSEALQALAQSPLILNTMCVAYQDAPTNELTGEFSESLEKLRNRIFDVYIDRMFRRKGNIKHPFTHAQTLDWLAWLAQQTIHNDQTVFLIEKLQPSWLSNRIQIWVYALFSRFTNGLILGLLPSLFLGLFALGDHLINSTFYNNILSGQKNDIEDFINLLVIIAFFSLSSGGYGLAIGLFNAFRWSTKASIGFQIIIAVIAIILSWGLLLPLIIPFGLRERRRTLENDIDVVESFGWSWRRSIVGAAIGFILGGTTCLFMDSISSFGLNQYGELRSLLLLLIGGFMIGVTPGLVLGGLNARTIETKTFPNQGIWLSLRKAIIIGPIVGIVSMLGFFMYLIWTILWLSGNDPLGLSTSPLSYLFIALVIAIPVFLWYGGFDAIQHYVLRLILWRTNRMPLNYVRFLDYASDLIFLRKVGGGYIFIHRMLQEHFASLAKENLHSPEPHP